MRPLFGVLCFFREVATQRPIGRPRSSLNQLILGWIVRVEALEPALRALRIPGLLPTGSHYTNGSEREESLVLQEPDELPLDRIYSTAR